MWEKEFEFAKDNYNGGDLAINSNENKAILLYVNQEKVKFVDVQDDKGGYIDSKFEKEWMEDSNERLNRMSVEVLSGGRGKVDKIIFKEQAQTGQWWKTKDLKTIYLNTYFIDYSLVNSIPMKDQIRKARIYKIFKSSDGGETFNQLKSWPPYRQVKQILLDENGIKGYAIGEQKSLWRTSDGGETWVQIHMPKAIIDQLNMTKMDVRIDEIFNSYHFDELTKDFYFSNLFVNKQGVYFSVIYKLPWSDDPKSNEVTNNQIILTLEKSDIVDINTINNSVYALGMVYDFSNKTFGEVDTEMSFLSAIEDDSKNYKWQKKIKISNGIQLGKLYIGNNHTLYSSGFKNSEQYPFQRDISAVSFDNGDTWQIDEDGNMLQASSFDPETNLVYMLKGGEVSSRKISKLTSIFGQ